MLVIHTAWTCDGTIPVSYTHLNLMCCLAFQGDGRALETLLELENHPRSWRKKLYVDPSIYAQCGGWTFNKKGQRTQLNFDTCFSFVKGAPGEDVYKRQQ